MLGTWQTGFKQYRVSAPALGAMHCLCQNAQHRGFTSAKAALSGPSRKASPVCVAGLHPSSWCILLEKPCSRPAFSPAAILLTVTTLRIRALTTVERCAFTADTQRRESRQAACRHCSSIWLRCWPRAPDSSRAASPRLRSDHGYDAAAIAKAKLDIQPDPRWRGCEDHSAHSALPAIFRRSACQAVLPSCSDHPCRLGIQPVNDHVA